MCVYLCARARFSQNILPFLPTVGIATIWIYIVRLIEFVATRFKILIFLVPYVNICNVKSVSRVPKSFRGRPECSYREYEVHLKSGLLCN